MNRTILSYGSILFLSLIALSCKKQDSSISITGLSLSPNKLVLDVGKSSALTATISPPNASDQTLLWSSVDTTIATVNTSGIVTGTGPGVVTIKVTSRDRGLSSLSVVTVTKWTKYTSTNSGLTNDTINSIAISGDGNKWFGTFNGISEYDGSTWTTYNTSNSNLLSNYVSFLGIDNQDNKWFMHTHGLSKFDNTAWTIFDTINSGLAGYPVNAIAFDAQDTGWIGTGEGISKFDGTNWTTYNTANTALLDDAINSICIDAHGNIWIGNLGGVSKFDGTNWHWYSKGDGLAGYGVNVMVMDKQGNMWFGTSDGLSKFDGTNWTTYLANTQINAIAVDAHGVLWVARTYEIVNDERVSGGVSKFDGENWTTFNTANSGLVNNTVISIGIDANDNKWFGTVGGISEMQDHANN